MAEKTTGDPSDAGGEPNHRYEVPAQLHIREHERA